jgi:ferredoxin
VKAKVDENKCQGPTLCAMAAPDFFLLSDIDGHATVASEQVPDDQEQLVRDAIGSCPEQAIAIWD